MSVLKNKLKEVLSSVLPIVVIVTLLHFTLAPLDKGMFAAFLIGSLLILIGLTIFLFGIDLSIDSIGHDIGSFLMQKNKIALVTVVSLILGFFISFAEPDLHILASQVSIITSGEFGRWLMVIVVSIGLGIMMTLGMLRILKDVPLKYTFLFAYGLIFILSLFSSPDFLAIAFDASGATTGAITTPFMLSLAGGVVSMKKDSKTSEASNFGLVGISSTGAIIGVLSAGVIMGIDKLSGIQPVAAPVFTSVSSVYLSVIPVVAKDTFLSLLPILLSYLFFQFKYFKQDKSKMAVILKGLLLTYIGLLMFLSGVNSGFMQVGKTMGMKLAGMESKAPILILSFLLGLVTVLAEPAVMVLTHQIEDITSGHVKRSLVLIFLSISVGLAIFMAALRIIVPGIQLWMYLLAGFGAAVAMAFFTPDLFVGLAFDAGGVASGPMTATFSLAFVQGIAIITPGADMVSDGFGMIAIVAMMPIVALQLLGILYNIKTRKSN